ncbi:hypothetical protein [Pseudoxanthomonas sp. SE1]|uniref:hypothetical protein n=1 Tax=Pseudoxanthomonas sp. SE1 TaxID=1664560 RepID=UPI00240D9AFD|nr:hypothetical protein [Pseudoxanthomonas sp. SE1]WFC40545.1 hypothetical protein OY559_12005 [Pseudoxanthomonas sp. SE1]
MKACLVALALLFTWPSVGWAQSLERLEQLERLEKAVEVIDQVDAKLDSLIRVRRAECRRAFGYEPFCDCIMDALPVAWSFADYVAITTRSKEQNGYANLDAEYRSAYDKVPGIRDQCVAKLPVAP